MREICCMVKAGIRRGKREFVSILILAFLTSLTLVSILTINSNTAAREKESLEEAGFTTLFVGFANQKLTMAGIDVDNLSDQIEGVDKVQNVKKYDAAVMQIENLNGKESSNRMIVTSLETCGLNYSVLQDGKIRKAKEIKIKDGEIYVPFSLQTLYSCELGDTIKLKGAPEEFCVAGFFEDPMMGGAMMGIKTLLISEKDLQKLSDYAREQTFEDSAEGSYHLFTMCLIQKEDNCDWSDLEFEQYVNEKTNFESYSDYTLSLSQAMGYMLILTRVFTGILAAFVVLLVVIVLITIGHSINSNIELEYVNVGILKAMGFTGAKLKAAFLIQYLLTAVIGILLGVPAAIPIIRLVNEMTRAVTCLEVSNKIAGRQCLAAEVGVLVFIAGFILIKLGKIAGITPMRAIADANDTVYFSNRLQMKLRKKGLSAWIALRELTSNGKQYISSVAITILMVFCLSIVGEINGWIGSDGSSLLNLFLCYEGDFDVTYLNQEQITEVEKTISEKTKIEKTFRYASEYLTMKGSKMMCNICESPEEFVTVYEGRTCKYDNEILLTEFTAKEFHLSIGDTVFVTAEGKKEAYIISGFYECANDMGSNFGMCLDGYRRLMGKEPENMSVVYQVSEGTDIEALIERLENKYDGKDIEVSNLKVFDDFGTIVDAIHGICFLMYGIVAVFVIVTVSMVCAKIFYREKKDFGIYKAMGFFDGSLRLQFALRFLGVAVVGSIGGILLDMALSGNCAAILFAMMGCHGGNESVADIAPMIRAAGFVIGLFFLVSYLKAGKIKSVEPTILISE